MIEIKIKTKKVVKKVVRKESIKIKGVKHTLNKAYLTPLCSNWQG